MAYQIKIHNFEGPFDLLFHLIEKSEVDIYDIPIAEITNQYLEYIYEMESLDLDVASEFVVMAATLIQIKSKMLLPKELNNLDEIALDGEDLRAELIEKLLEYKKYKQASETLKIMEEKYIDRIYKHGEIIDDIEEDNILLNINLNDIVNAFNDVIKRYKESHSEDKHLDEQIIREEFTVADKIEDLKIYLKINKKFTFKNLFNNAQTKFEIIITFLALLELMKLKEIQVYQSKIYGEIFIEKI